MSLQLRIKIGLLAAIITFAPNIVFSQRDTLHYVRSPYGSESTPHFQFGQFKRGFSNDSLKFALDKLESKPRKSWSRTDSLNFAEISLQTGNKNLAHYYFESLNINFKTEKKYWYDHLMITYLDNLYNEGLTNIKKSSPMILEFSTIHFFKKIFEAKLESQGDSKWYKKNKVLDWEVDSTLNELDKTEDQFQIEVVKPLRNLEIVLKLIISYVHEEDQVIALACREMGHIIEAHLSLTQAHIAYSLGRHYNKWDKELLADLKAVKAKMTKKKYKIPNFRKYFPRIEYWRFDYNVLKEKVIFAKNDTNNYVVPATMQPKKEENLNFPSQYIILGGLALFFVLILIFLKTRK